MSILHSDTVRTGWGPCPTNPNTGQIEMLFDADGKEVGSVNEFYGEWSCSVAAYGGVIGERATKEEAKLMVERMARLAV